MKHPLQPLDRLFQSAARGQPPGTSEVPGEPPPGFEIRVTAEWNVARTTGDYLGFIHYLRPVLAGACLLIMIGAWLNWTDATTKTLNEAAYADAAIRYQLLP